MLILCNHTVNGAVFAWLVFLFWRARYERRREVRETLLRGSKMDVRSPALAPDAIAGTERTFSSPDEYALLLAGKPDHSPTLIRVAERCENPLFGSKIRVVHVRGLDCSGKSKRHLSEVIRGHFVSLSLRSRQPPSAVCQ